MYRINYTKALPKKQYKHNRGQHLEQLARYNLTGEILPADNVPFWVSGDVGKLQIKSAKAHAVEGWDIDSYIQNNAAEEYAWALQDESGLVIMDKAEYKAFVLKFSNECYSSEGLPIRRFKTETDEIKGYFDIALNGKTRYNTRYWYLWG